MENYNLNTFLESHKRDSDLGYFECIMLPDGTLIEAVNGHVNTICKVYNKPRHIIDEEMPISASPIHWLVDHTNCISIWKNQYLRPEVINIPQRLVLTILKNRNFLYKDCKEIIVKHGREDRCYI